MVLDVDSMCSLKQRRWLLKELIKYFDIHNPSQYLQSQI